MSFIIAFLATLVIGTVMRGWVLCVLWKWFIVPVFHITPLTIFQALGIGLLVTCLTNHSCQKSDDDDDDEEEVIIKVVAMGIGVPLVILFIGWIIHLFV